MDTDRTVTLETRVPAQLRKEMQMLVTKGWYADENDVVLDALRRFLATHRADLLERQIREDIEWGLHGQE